LRRGSSLAWVGRPRPARPETAKIGAAELATYVVEKGRPLFNLAEEGRHV
jgi:hypothetical protein